MVLATIFSYKFFPLALIFVFGASLVFQIAHLTTTSLWHDEAFSALLIQYEDYGEMLHRIALDVHPPLYYMILRLWSGFAGDSLFSLRFFSLFFGLLCVALTFLLAKDIFQNKKLALVSALVLGMSSFQIQYHLEARMYTLGAFFLLLATYFLLRGLKAQIPSNRFFLFMGIYALCAVAALYTHYYTVFGIFAHALFIIYWVGPHLKKLLFAGTAFAAIGFLFLPWLPTFLRQLSQVQDAYWIPPITKWSLPTTISNMVIGDGLAPHQAALVIIAINIFVAAALITTLWHYQHREKWMFALLFVIPFLGSVLLSMKTSIYLYRYFVLYLPFLITALIAAAFAIPQKQIRFAILTILVLGSAISYPIHWYVWDLQDKPGMQEASSYIISSVKPNDKIISNSPFVYFTFRYYNTSYIHPLLYAPDDLPHFSGTALLNPEDTLQTFDIAETGDTVWTIDTTGFGNLQPTVPTSWQKQEEKEFPDAYIHRGSIIVRKYLIDT